MSAARSVREFPEMRLRFSVSEEGRKLVSPYQSVEIVAIVGRTGKPYDVLCYRDKPNVSVVVWGIDAQGAVRIGIHRQSRALPDNPEQPSSSEPVDFICLPGGYLERSPETNEVTESLIDGAVREAYEELGLSAVGIAVKKVELPSCPSHNLDPALYATWSNIVFIEVELSGLPAKFGGEGLDEDEWIEGMEFMPFKKLLENIRLGKDEHGAFCRAAETNSALLVFIAHHQELLKELLGA